MTNNNSELTNSFLQLARIALTGRDQDIHLVIHRASKKVKTDFPEVSNELVKLLQETPTRSTPLRRDVDIPLPVDVDSRLHLLKIESADLEHEIILSDSLKDSLNQVISERRNSKVLLELGLQPTKTLLFNGPPGVGKTMAAKWIANQLKKPLLVLDLAAVMSSFLGRTGNNIRFVLEYAKNANCVLLIDELDAIAKRRDDNSEVGELKRLVTVLLQEIDDWPSSGLLIAATNHPALLDPAIWRRFEVTLQFEKPEPKQISELLKVLLNGHISDDEHWSKILPIVFSGESFSEIERQIQLIRKVSAIQKKPLSELLNDLLKDVKKMPRDKRSAMAETMMASGFSQRQVNEITGISRDTLRKQKG